MGTRWAAHAGSVVVISFANDSTAAEIGTGLRRGWRGSNDGNTPVLRHRFYVKRPIVEVVDERLAEVIPNG